MCTYKEGIRNGKKNHMRARCNFLRAIKNELIDVEFTLTISHFGSNPARARAPHEHETSLTVPVYKV